jgi:hypothetical protein
VSGDLDVRAVTALERIAAALEKLVGIPVSQARGFQPRQLVAVPVVPVPSLQFWESRSWHVATWREGQPPLVHCAARVNSTFSVEEAVPAETVHVGRRCSSPGCKNRWPTAS